MHTSILTELSRPENRNLLVIGLWTLVALWVGACALVVNQIPQQAWADLKAWAHDLFPPTPSNVISIEEARARRQALQAVAAPWSQDRKAAR